ncbi:unnamed protein product [Arctia plantaginis]|uniref:Uncharacterized protein n=1 Tax=Arctia plantaginis TaxID=874455 RepID=A0A8S1A9I7_ARCPL|nr:unnamed protein product [Arctia plantaginis]
MRLSMNSQMRPHSKMKSQSQVTVRVCCAACPTSSISYFCSSDSQCVVRPAVSSAAFAVTDVTEYSSTGFTVPSGQGDNIKL